MKLQHLAIIFVIIIVPISLVLSIYMGHQIDVIEYQSKYDTFLLNATYDAIKAFQLNTINNDYSTIGNSKIRDIEASISTYYTSLATNFGASGYSKEELQSYTPAILFTLYDGYYIYSNYYDTEQGKYVFGLKPFIYYSCRYVRGSNYDFVVNYTLDNAITIIGKVDGNYETRTGYFINPDNIPTNIDAETLSENLIIMNENNEPEKKDANENPVAEEYQYIIYNNQKYYRNRDEYINLYTDDTSKLRHKYFIYSSEYKKDYVNSLDMLAELEANTNFQSDSAKKYYEEAEEFSNWIDDKLGTITAADAKEIDGTTQITSFATDTGTDKIFKLSDANDPLQMSSTFNEHRMNVIRKSIETNLITSIKTFSDHTVLGYEFGMPKISEDEWYKIENNITIVSFLQGIPVGGRVYSNYFVVSNDANKETVGNDSIYIVTNTSGKIEYHKPGCKTLMENVKNGNSTIIAAYASIDFKRKSISLTGADANAGEQLTGASVGKYAYFYPQQGTACYDCIVTVSDVYSTDDIIKGEIQVRDTNGNIIQTIKESNNDGLKNIKKWYMTALARTRYDLYLTNGYFGY